MRVGREDALKLVLKLHATHSLEVFACRALMIVAWQYSRQELHDVSEGPLHFLLACFLQTLCLLLRAFFRAKVAD